MVLSAVNPGDDVFHLGGSYYGITALPLNSCAQQCHQLFPIFVYLSIPKETETLGTSGSREESLCALAGFQISWSFFVLFLCSPFQVPGFPEPELLLNYYVLCELIFEEN